MKIPNPIIMLSTLMAISGCSPVGMNSMATRTQLSNPTFKAYVISDCMRKVGHKLPGSPDNMAELMGTSDNKAAALYCQRMVEALQSGRISLSDVQSIKSWNDSSKIRNIVLRK